MKALAVLAIAASTCFGSDISGVWRLKHASADGLSFPAAIQVEQCGDQLQVLKLISTTAGKRIEQFWVTAAAIHTSARAIEIFVAGEIWIIGARGELTIQETNGDRVELEPAEGGVL